MCVGRVGMGSEVGVEGGREELSPEALREREGGACVCYLRRGTSDHHTQ